MTYSNISPENQSAFWRTFKKNLDEYQYQNTQEIEWEVEAAVVAGTLLLNKIEKGEKVDHTSRIDQIWRKIACI
ncbi:hypothetical protein KAR34_00755 [bacterium]|nr:hypothetical protein [bacterium]